jgi:hypothetical protein
MSVAVCVQLKEFVRLDELHYSGGHRMEIIMVFGFDLFTLADTMHAYYCFLKFGKNV